ncbi:MAG: methionyl-tRNA formyltransferase [Prevotellaceae bacterium]|jgi:methionyl-tRNA formyltransferase|nr:methionyl-tRNA formyltransferase [Prevotellaceae bacterium]
MKNDFKIVYMGTPEFAVEPLKALIEGGYRIAAVVTAPDRPAGRGLEIKSTEVKQFALANSLPVLQPEKLRDAQFIDRLNAINADLFVVVAFRMLPETVWSLPAKGTINLHASLLPDYRGAAPINHAIINGEKETGVTTFLISHKIDTGAILLSAKVGIGDNETAGELHNKLQKEGSQLLLQTVEMLKNGNVEPQPQIDRQGLKLAPKLFRHNCRIDWTQSAEKIRNLIRGLSPYPGAWTEYTVDNKTYQMKIYQASAETRKHGKQIGAAVSDGKKYLKIACDDGYLNIEIMQIQGKKTMPVNVFLSGFRETGKMRFL